MRVVILNRVAPPAHGATGRVLAELAAALRGANHQVQAITAGNMPQHKWAYAKALLSIGLRALCTRRADLIVIMTDPPLLVFWAPLLKWRHRAPVVYWCQDLYPDLLPLVNQRVPNWLMRLFKTIQGRVLRGLDGIIAIGRCMQHELATRYAIAPDNITVINNWAEQSLGAHPRQQDEFIVLYAGNMGPLHPCDAIIDAARILKNDAIKFIIMGSGSTRAACQSAAADLPNVKFKGFLPAHAAHNIQGLANIHLASLAPTATGLCVPVKVMSAFACHCPCIFIGAADAEPALLIRDYNAGAVVPPGDGAALAAQIKNYATDHARWQAAANGARTAHGALNASLQLAQLTGYLLQMDKHADHL